MNDIHRASMNRVRKAYEKAGFELRTPDNDQSPVRFWLYSCSVSDKRKQPRLVSQISSELYNDMLSSKGMMNVIDADPADCLAGCLDDFDKKKGGESESDRQVLALMLARYAIHTRSWGSVRPLSEVSGVHFVVLDWEPDGLPGICLRPAIQMNQDHVMSMDQLRAFQSMAMQIHFQRRPQEKPKGYQG